VPQLMPGEHPIRVTRQHWTVFLSVAFACAVALAVGIVLLVVTPSSVAGHGLHQIKVFIGLALGIIVVAIFLVRWLQWHSTSFTLTNHRIISRSGILSRYTESITLDRIQDSSVRQRLIGRVLSFGDLEIESAGRDGAEVLRHIANPGAFSRDLLVASEARRTGQPFPGGAGDLPPGGGYAPPTVQGPGPTQPGAYGPSPGYSGHHDGV
jgi:uncharacterized membrane protein YdbT with pleckstrin-like domain